LLGGGEGADDTEAGGEDDDDGLARAKAVCWRETGCAFIEYGAAPDEVLGGSMDRETSVLVRLGIDA